MRAAIEGEWAFADPEWTRWLTAQITAAEQGRLDGPLAALSVLAVPAPAGSAAKQIAPVAGTAPSCVADPSTNPALAEESAEIEYADDPRGRAIAAYIAERGDPRIYSSWLARTALERLSEDAVEVAAEDGFVAEWVARKYGERLTELLSVAAGRPLELRLSVAGVTAATLRSTIGAPARSNGRDE